MPLYDLKNKDTGEVFEVMMSYTEYQQYLQDNPNLERYFGSEIHFIDEISIGRKKPPEEFQKYVIERIKKNNPGNKMESRWETPREW